VTPEGICAIDPPFITFLIAEIQQQTLLHYLLGTKLHRYRFLSPSMIILKQPAW
jgi:hypothetical protein